MTVPSTSSKSSDGAVDIRGDDDMDATWFGASTVGGLSTLGAASAGGGGSDAESGNGWDDDEHDLGDLVSPLTTSRKFQTADAHVVDHVPRIASPTLMDASSTAPVVDQSVIVSEAKDDNLDGGSFGAVVDHTPSVTKISQWNQST